MFSGFLGRYCDFVLDGALYRYPLNSVCTTNVGIELLQKIVGRDNTLAIASVAHMLHLANLGVYGDTQIKQCQKHLEMYPISLPRLLEDHVPRFAEPMRSLYVWMLDTKARTVHLKIAKYMWKSLQLRTNNTFPSLFDTSHPVTKKGLVGIATSFYGDVYTVGTICDDTKCYLFCAVCTIMEMREKPKYSNKICIDKDVKRRVRRGARGHALTVFSQWFPQIHAYHDYLRTDAIDIRVQDNTGKRKIEYANFDCYTSKSILAAFCEWTNLPIPYPSNSRLDKKRVILEAFVGNLLLETLVDKAGPPRKSVAIHYK